LLSVIEKRKILKQIAEGKVYLQKKVKAKNGKEKVVSMLPDYTDVMRAIDLDNKMAGDYAPEKKALIIEDDLSELSDKELQEQLKKNKELLK
jgi:hypothetical protein